MKKILFGFTAIMLLFVVGCGKSDKKNDENVAPNPVEITGDTLDISLKAQPSSGYSWEYEIAGDDAIILSNKFIENENCKGRFDCDGYEIFTVKAKAKGELNINFNYSTAMEKNDDDLKAVFEISIDKNLKITEKHSGSYFDTEK